jgi:hypothetical protein
MRRYLRYILAFFGSTSFVLTSSLLLNLFKIREIAGNYVLIIVWANFIVSIFYLVVAFEYVKIKKWSGLLLTVSAIILIMAFLGLKVHINSGGKFEFRIINIMYFRIYLTLILSALAYRLSGIQLKTNT